MKTLIKEIQNGYVAGKSSMDDEQFGYLVELGDYGNEIIDLIDENAELRELIVKVMFSVRKKPALFTTRAFVDLAIWLDMPDKKPKHAWFWKRIDELVAQERWKKEHAFAKRTPDEVLDFYMRHAQDENNQ